MLTKIRFVANAGLPAKIVMGVFLIKVAAGLFIGKINEHNISSDSWGYHLEALKEYRLLWESPGQYFSNIFQSGYTDKYAGLFESTNSFWNDLKNNLITKLISVLDIFSGGNYYVNVVLYNFLLFFGSIALYRLFKQVYQASQYTLIVMVFLLPSVLLYTSTIHKDGLVFSMLGILLFNYYQCLHITGFTIKKIFYILFALAIIFFLRNYIVLALLPALVVWFISFHVNYRTFSLLAIGYVLVIISFFNLHKIFPAVNLEQAFIKKQAEFIFLEKGSTHIGAVPLQATARSFAENLPHAFNHSLFRPYLTDVKLSIQLLPFAIEIVFYQILFVLFIFCKKTETINNKFLPVSLFFSFSVLLIVGYIVPNIGAIIRYRSIYLPFLIAPVISRIDLGKLRGLFKIKK